MKNIFIRYINFQKSVKTIRTRKRIKRISISCKIPITQYIGKLFCARHFLLHTLPVELDTSGHQFAWCIIEVDIYNVIIQLFNILFKRKLFERGKQKTSLLDFITGMQNRSLCRIKLFESETLSSKWLHNWFPTSTYINYNLACYSFT